MEKLQRACGKLINASTPQTRRDSNFLQERKKNQDNNPFTSRVNKTWVDPLDSLLKYSTEENVNTAKHERNIPETGRDEKLCLRQPYPRLY
jgi:hypothetical protein